MPNCQGLSVGVPKFSAVIKSKAAAAMSPTTVGRNNSNMDFTTVGDSRLVEAVFKGIRPAVVALIAAPCIKLARTAHITLNNLWLPVFTALAIWLMGISPIYIVLLVAVGGFLYGKLVKS